MKKLSFLLSLVIAITFLSACSSEDGDPSATYDFKEQIAQGQIEGEAWTFEAGKALLTEDQDGNPIYSIKMYSNNETITEVCSFFGAEFDEVFFSLPTEIGVYKLSFSSSNSRTVTLFDRENIMNVIASDGAVEIIAISETQITGRADIRSGNDNFINGNFTLEICGN
ncbi:MAG: hypothetical protein ACOCXH_02115 [Cyclobacteriaceae bacterium]